jgi:hypothetical protein
MACRTNASRIQKDIIIEEDVVDAEDAFSRTYISSTKGNGMQVQVQTEMQIMVEVWPPVAMIQST